MVLQIQTYESILDESLVESVKSLLHINLDGHKSFLPAFRSHRVNDFLGNSNVIAAGSVGNKTALLRTYKVVHYIS